MPRDEGFIVAPGECDELGAQVLDGFERPHQSKFSFKVDEALGDAIASGSRTKDGGFECPDI